MPRMKAASGICVGNPALPGSIRVRPAAAGRPWGEFDTTDRAWTIPATRTKSKREHRVSLFGRAGQILDAWGRLATAARS